MTIGGEYDQAMQKGVVDAGPMTTDSLNSFASGRWPTRSWTRRWWATGSPSCG